MMQFLVRVAFACRVFAPAIDVRRLFHCLALRAAILACRCRTGTNWVSALVAFRGIHLFPPFFLSRAGDPSLEISPQECVFLYRKEHISIVIASLQR